MEHNSYTTLLLQMSLVVLVVLVLHVFHTYKLNSLTKEKEENARKIHLSQLEVGGKEYCEILEFDPRDYDGQLFNQHCND